VKFAPRHSQIVGRMVIKRSDSKIIRTDETKVTKFVIVDAVGVEAAAAGIKVGDVVVATKLNHMFFDAGTRFRPLIEEKDIACLVTDLRPGDLLVQAENGTQYVLFDSPEAAEPLGAQPKPRAESEAA
jgi:hypothetical protein